MHIVVPALLPNLCVYYQCPAWIHPPLLGHGGGRGGGQRTASFLDDGLPTKKNFRASHEMLAVGTVTRTSPSRLGTMGTRKCLPFTVSFPMTPSPPRGPFPPCFGRQVAQRLATHAYVWRSLKIGGSAVPRAVGVAVEAPMASNGLPKQFPSAKLDHGGSFCRGREASE
jgi:hypothetical protein